MALKLGVNLRTIPVTSNYTVTAFDDIINVDATSGAVTVTLPDATTIPGKAIKVNKVDATTNLVTITGPQLINGSSSVALANQNESLEIGSVNSVYALIGAGLRSVQSNLVSNKNYLINGNWDFFQRGTSMVASGTSYIADRWLNNTGFTVTYSRQTTGAPRGSTNFIRCAYTGAGAAGLTQCLESFMVNMIQGKVVCFSVKLRRNASYVGSVVLRIRKNATADTGTGGSWSTIQSLTIPSTSIPVSTSSATDWVQFYFSALIPTDGTANGVSVSFEDQSAQINGGISEYAQMMLTEGSSPPSNFQMAANHIGQELVLCQRFFEKSYNIDKTPGNSEGGQPGVIFQINPSSATFVQGQELCNNVQFKVTKRATPTVVFYSFGGTAGRVADSSTSDMAAGSANPGDAGMYGCQVRNNSSTTLSPGTRIIFHFTADAELN